MRSTGAFWWMLTTWGPGLVDANSWKRMIMVNYNGLVVHSDMFAALTHFFHFFNLSSCAIRNTPIHPSVDIFDEVHVPVVSAQLNVLQLQVKVRYTCDDWRIHKQLTLTSFPFKALLIFFDKFWDCLTSPSSSTMTQAPS